MRNKPEHMPINCCRLITKDLRPYLLTATKKPIIWEAKGTSEEKLKSWNKFETGLGIEAAEGNGKSDGARRHGRKSKGSKATCVRLGNALSLLYK